MDFDNISIFAMIKNTKLNMDIPFAKITLNQMKLRIEKSQILNLSLLIKEIKASYFMVNSIGQLLENTLLGEKYPEIIHEIEDNYINFKKLCDVEKYFDNSNINKISDIEGDEKKDLKFSLLIEKDGNKIIDIDFSKIYINIQMEVLLKLANFGSFQKQSEEEGYILNYKYIKNKIKKRI